VLRFDRKGAGIHQGETARTVRVLHIARLEAGVAEQRGLLIARHARHRNFSAEEFASRRAEKAGGRLDFRKYTSRHFEQAQKLIVPAALMNIEEHGSARIGGVGRVRAGQFIDEPRIDGAEHELAPFGAGLQFGMFAEEPGEFGSGKIRIEHKTRLFADERFGAACPQFVADAARAAALPDNRIVHGLSGRALPHDHSLSLICDADCRDLPGLDLRRIDGTASSIELGLPDLFGIVLDPARLGENLPERNLFYADDDAIVVEQNGPGRRRALIQGENIGCFAVHGGIITHFDIRWSIIWGSV